MIDSTNGPHGRLARLGTALAVLFVAAVVTLWFWNTAAVELFGAPRAGFTDALAFQLAVLATLAPLWMITHRAGHRAPPRDQ